MKFTLRMDACMHRFGFYKPYWLVDIGELPSHLDSPFSLHQMGLTFCLLCVVLSC